LDSFWENFFKPNGGVEETYQFLAKIPIFSGLKTRELRAIERIVHCRDYQPGESIFRKGDPGVGMYIIRKGSIRIVLENEENLHPKKPAPSALEENAPAQDIFLAQLGSGDFFGDASLPDGAPRSATAIATEETSLIGLFRPDLMDLCNRDPHTGIKVLWNICEVLAARLRRTNSDLRKLRLLFPEEVVQSQEVNETSHVEA